MTQRSKSTVAVGYIRMSSDKQEQSPAQQRRMAIRFLIYLFE